MLSITLQNSYAEGASLEQLATEVSRVAKQLQVGVSTMITFGGHQINLAAGPQTTADDILRHIDAFLDGRGLQRCATGVEAASPWRKP